MTPTEVLQANQEKHVFCNQSPSVAQPLEPQQYYISYEAEKKPRVACDVPHAVPSLPGEEGLTQLLVLPRTVQNNP